MNVGRGLKEWFKRRILGPLLQNMDVWEAEVFEEPGAMRGCAESPVRFDIPREGLALEGDHAPMPGFPGSFPQLLGSLANIRRSVRDLERNPRLGRRTIDEETLAALERYARSVGVDEIGYTAVPREWVFQDTAIMFSQAIVLVLEMDKARMARAPNRDTAVMVHETYNVLGRAANKIAGWLRERGYAAQAGHPLGGMALYPPMAQAAGLGWRGLHGLIVTPRFGPRVRLAAVFTEIENLPVYEGDEYAWILEFCEWCRRCERECPPGAFYDQPVTHASGLVTVLDHDDCFPYFMRHHGCSICIKVCPFNVHPYEKIKMGFERKRLTGQRLNYQQVASEQVAGQQVSK